MAKQTLGTARLQDLLAYPREDLDVEMKGWLDPADNAHKANLAQALLALANHGGGHVVIGFKESGGQWIPDPGRPSSLAAFTQDWVNGIVASYAEPVFHCELHQVPFPGSSELFPIIVVPSIQAVPVRARRDGPQDAKGRPQHVNINSYYIRRPGPKSESPQSGQEWDQLIRRCIRSSRSDLLDAISGLLSGAAPALAQPPVESSDSLAEWVGKAERRRKQLLEENPSKNFYQDGVWTCAYLIRGTLKKLSQAAFFDVVKSAKGSDTGWPVWVVLGSPELAPYPMDGLIECWLKDGSFQDAAHTDYWLASPDGRMYLVRGYQEDATDQLTPGKKFDLTIPVWRVAECLRHARRMAELLGAEDGLIEIEFKWTGLKGRELTAWASPLRMVWDGRTAKQDTVTSRATVQVDQIDTTLPSIVSELTQPLYNVFDFFEPPVSMVEEEIAAMLGRRAR